jgi:hypothetical protein
VAVFGSPPARGGVAPASGDEVVGAADGAVDLFFPFSIFHFFTSLPFSFHFSSFSFVRFSPFFVRFKDIVVRFIPKSALSATCSYVLKTFWYVLKTFSAL